MEDLFRWVDLDEGENLMLYELDLFVERHYHFYFGVMNSNFQHWRNLLGEELTITRYFNEFQFASHFMRTLLKNSHQLRIWIRSDKRNKKLALGSEEFTKKLGELTKLLNRKIGAELAGSIDFTHAKMNAG